MSSTTAQNDGTAMPPAPQIDKTDPFPTTETDPYRVEATERCGFIVGFWLLLALLADSHIFGLEATHDLSQVWQDGIWIGVSGLGALVSAFVTIRLMSDREPGKPPRHIPAVAGLVISIAMVVVLTLEETRLMMDLFAMDPGVIWSATRPLWLFPLSILGFSLPMISLILARGGDRRDGVLGVLFSCAPIAMLSIPFLGGFDSAETARWFPMIYGVSGFALILSGVKLRSVLQQVTIAHVNKLSSRVFIVTLLLVGSLIWRKLSPDQTLSSSVDVVWVAPLFVNAVLSALVLAVIFNTPSKDRNRSAGFLLSYSALTLSVYLLCFLTLDFVSGTPLLPRTMWFYPLSLAGTSFVMISVTLLASETQRDKIVGILTAAVPCVATTAVAVAAFLFAVPLTASYSVLSGGTALLVYVGFAVAIFACGMIFGTYRTTQWPVVRERLRLLINRTSVVTRQILKNPMGLIGISILIAFITLAFIGPHIAPYEVDMTRDGTFDRLLPHSPEHWMGTDTFGHDIFSELLYGARTSITVGIVAAIISSVLGAAIGLYSGYAGGWKDEVIMRLNDIVLSIPWLVLMIIIAAFMGSIDLLGIILVIGLTGWSGTARLVRAQVLSLRERQYVEKARAIGSGDLHIIRAHILPNAFPLVFANTILTVAISILSEATLSFLGLRPYGVVTWGTMLSYAQSSNAFTIGLHWWIIAPGLCIVLVVLGFTLLGYALDDVMNPKLRKR